MKMPNCFSCFISILFDLHNLLESNTYVKNMKNVLFINVSSRFFNCFIIRKNLIKDLNPIFRRTENIKIHYVRMFFF